jgi:hypothetical protein
VVEVFAQALQQNLDALTLLHRELAEDLRAVLESLVRLSVMSSPLAVADGS